MSTNQFLPESVERFVLNITRETELQKQLREETSSLPQHAMQISADEGAFLAFLVKALGARRILEIGTFTGYSSLAMALALPDDGKLTACDMSRAWTDVAQRYWQEAMVAHKMELRLGQAQDTLEMLFKEGRANSYDFAFVDADKVSYDHYYEACLKLVRAGGVIAFDNMLWNGTVADPDNNDPDAVALRKLNLKLRGDTRVDVALLTIADGVTLVRRKV